MAMCAGTSVGTEIGKLRVLERAWGRSNRTVGRTDEVWAPLVGCLGVKSFPPGDFLKLWVWGAVAVVRPQTLYFSLYTWKMGLLLNSPS